MPSENPVQPIKGRIAEKKTGDEYWSRSCIIFSNSSRLSSLSATPQGLRSCVSWSMLTGASSERVSVTELAPRGRGINTPAAVNTVTSMEPSSSVVLGLFPRNKWILIGFAIYGLVAGLVWVIANEFNEFEILRQITLPMNVPSFMLLFWIVGENYTIPVPLPLWGAMVVVWSALVWTAIGVVCYYFSKALRRMAP